MNKRKYYRRTQHIINERIRGKELRVIAEDENLGILSAREALEIAREKGLDLVLIAPNAKPPVAKILDYNKFLYEERKKQSAQKARSKKSELKEFKLRPTTGEGDINRYAERAREFINEGNRVKISVVMRGRENAYSDVAMKKIDEVGEQLEDVAKQEDKPKRTGNTIWTVFVKQ